MNVSSIVINRAEPAEVFSKAGTDWFRSGDYGLTWAPFPTGDTDLLASDPTNPSVIYGREGSELRKTINHGLEWRPIVRGLKSTAISALLSDPVRPEHVYAAANNSGFLAGAATRTDLYETKDAGESWVRLSPIPANDVTTLGFDPVSATLYAQSDLGVFGSSDGAKSWRLLLPMAQSFSYLAMALAPSNPRIIFAGGPTLFRTTDGGSNWSSIPNVFGVSALAVDPRYADVLYAAGCDGKGFCGLLKSADSGMSWVRLAAPVSLSTNVLAIDAVDPRNVYAGGYDRVYRSSDEGLTWVAGGDVEGVVYLVAQPSVSGALLAIDGAARVLRSVDRGASWRALPAIPYSGCGGSFCGGLNSVVSLAIGPGLDALYVATLGQGVFTYRPVVTRRPPTVRAVPFR